MAKPVPLFDPAAIFRKVVDAGEEPHEPLHTLGFWRSLSGMTAEKQEASENEGYGVPPEEEARFLALMEKAELQASLGQ